MVYTWCNRSHKQMAWQSQHKRMHQTKGERESKSVSTAWTILACMCALYVYIRMLCKLPVTRYIRRVFVSLRMVANATKIEQIGRIRTEIKFGYIFVQVVHSNGKNDQNIQLLQITIEYLIEKGKIWEWKRRKYIDKNSNSITNITPSG